MRLQVLAGIAIASALGCTVHQTEAPTLSGPSSTAVTLSVTASPDVISLGQGSSTPGETSTIAAQVSRFDGKAVQPGSVRLDVLVPGNVNTSAPDCGQFSTRTLQFGSDGKTGTVKFTAPSFPIDKICPSFVAGSNILIAATLLDSSLQSSTVPIRLIGRAPDAPTPRFSVFPLAPTINESINFDASGSCPGTVLNNACVPNSGSIVSYQWDFGDGGGQTTSSPSVRHVFARVQTYEVLLTVTNDRGLSAAASKTVSVTSGNPIPVIITVPSPPKPGVAITFDASTTQPFGGAEIVSYEWTFLNAVPSSSTIGPITGPVIFGPLGGSALLKVTDSLGRVGTGSVAVTP